jgi:hypothetical protein
VYTEETSSTASPLKKKVSEEDLFGDGNVYKKLTQKGNAGYNLEAES